VPDWFGNNGRVFLQTGFTQQGNGSADYGGYSSPATDSLIARALAAESASIGAGLWAQAQRQIMGDAATVPLDYLSWPTYHSSRVQGCNFWWVSLNCDPTNIRLSP
jgi:peptide/nickel transport system substrate-binding protein